MQHALMLCCGAAAAADWPISIEDEAQLKLYYQVKLKAICQQLQLPSKVLVRPAHGTHSNDSINPTLLQSEGTV